MNVSIVRRTSFSAQVSNILFRTKGGVLFQLFIVNAPCSYYSATLLYLNQAYSLLIQGHNSTKRKYRHFYARIRASKLCVS